MGMGIQESGGVGTGSLRAVHLIVQALYCVEFCFACVKCVEGARKDGGRLIIRWK